MPESIRHISHNVSRVDEWLTYNEASFTALRTDEPKRDLHLRPLADVDRIAAELGVPVKEYFLELKERVGPLGRAALTLIRSQQSSASHIIIGENFEYSE